MFRCLPDAVLRSLPPCPPFQRPDVAFCPTGSLSCRIVARRTASLPLDPRPCQIPTDPVDAVESHLLSFTSRPLIHFGLAWPSDLSAQRDHSHGHGHTCLPPTVRPSQPRVFTRPVKSLSIRHRQSHISFSVFLYTPHPSSRPGRHVCRAVSLPPATRSRMHTHQPIGSCRSTFHPALLL